METLRMPTQVPAPEDEISSARTVRAPASGATALRPRAEPFESMESGACFGYGKLFEGKYRVDRVLGRGGVGVVLAATHTRLDQRVAIKVLLPKALEHKDARRRFEREARAAAKIVNEHVARVYDVGVLEGGTPYIVMEYLDGQDLSAILEERRWLPVGEAVDCILQACEALAEAHTAGIIHRDLKPANIFFARRADGTRVVKILDFGMSKLNEGTLNEEPITDSLLIMGSPGWMSPEQMRSTRDVDARADIWALGAVLYRALTGTVPYQAETIAQLYASLHADKPVPPSKIKPGLPEALDAVILQALAAEPDARYRNVSQLADALADFGPPRSRARAARIARVVGVAVDERGLSAALARRAPPTPSESTVRGLAIGASRRRASRRVIAVAAAVFMLIGLTLALMSSPVVRARRFASPPPRAWLATAYAAASTSTPLVTPAATASTEPQASVQKPPPRSPRMMHAPATVRSASHPEFGDRQ
jgi:serine/threonine-protein kinase